jgi:16S rRNA (uracil1498-N3)-methyltransferase
MGGSRAERPSSGDRLASSGGASRGPRGGPGRGPAAPTFRYLPRFFVEASRPLIFSDCAPTSEVGAPERELVLDPEDSHHALRVLRLAVGDACEVVVVPAQEGPDLAEGRGGVAFLANVTAATEEVRVRLVAPLQGKSAGASYTKSVGIVQAMTRPVAMDYLLEKGTEAGASFFVLVSVAGSTQPFAAPQAARLSRWRRIAREAAKQSKQLAVPAVKIAGSIDEALEGFGSRELSLVLEPGASDRLYDVVVEARRREDSGGGVRPARLALWVGPEGGWTEEDLARLVSAGAKTVRLGQGVLRAETAGPMAVAVARLALGDW